MKVDRTNPWIGRAPDQHLAVVTRLVRCPFTHLQNCSKLFLVCLADFRFEISRSLSGGTELDGAGDCGTSIRVELDRFR